MSPSPPEGMPMTICPANRPLVTTPSRVVQHVVGVVKESPFVRARSGAAAVADASKWCRVKSGKRGCIMSSPPPAIPLERSGRADHNMNKIYDSDSRSTARYSLSKTLNTLVYERIQTPGPSVLDQSGSVTPTISLPDCGSGFLPDPPVWAVYFVAGALTMGFVTAILLYFVNFPPELRRDKPRTNRHPYQEIRQEESEHEAAYMGVTTSTPTPPLARRRRQVAPPSIDISAANVQSGAAPPNDHRYAAESSEDPGSSLLDNSDTAFRSTLSLRQHTPDSAMYEFKHHDFDLEDGLLPPRLGRGQTPDASPSASVSTSESSSNASMLEMVGDGFEYVADRFTRILHDQVRGDPEDGLLLPVRDSEREGHPRWKKLR